MDRGFLIISTICFLAAVVRAVVALRVGIFRPGRFNFLAIGLGFVFQTAFLYIRGHAVGRCPLTNLFEVFIFLAWSVALIYLLVGPAYRLSLMGAFTAPLVVLLQGFALIAPIDIRHAVKMAPNPSLEFHASVSLVAYGAFALACIAGVMLPRPGAPAQDTSLALNFLPPAAADRSLCGDHTSALVGLHPLYHWDSQWVFYGPTLTAGASGGCHWRLGALRRYFARPTSSARRTKANCDPLYCRI